MVPPLIMPCSVFIRIDSYRESLLSTTSTQNHDDQSHPLPGDEQGSSNPPHGQTGDRGAQAASGVMSAIIGDEGGEKAAGAGLEQFSESTPGLPVLEDIDEDAEDADATTRDDLILLAHDNPMWMGELRRYLQEVEKEKEQMQNERVARLARWREDIAIQLT